jgi:hypothetical protein
VDDPDDWYMSHWTRAIPAGYIDTLASGRNRIEDTGLAEYYDKLCAVTRGDLISLERLRTLWHMNTGRHDHLLTSYAQRVRAQSEEDKKREREEVPEKEQGRSSAR